MRPRNRKDSVGCLVPVLDARDCLSDQHRSSLFASLPSNCSRPPPPVYQDDLGRLIIARPAWRCQYRGLANNSYFLPNPRKGLLWATKWRPIPASPFTSPFRRVHAICGGQLCPAHSHLQSPRIPIRGSVLLRTGGRQGDFRGRLLSPPARRPVGSLRGWDLKGKCG